MGYTECGALGNVCCLLPAGVGNPHVSGGGGHGTGGVVGGGGSGGYPGGGVVGGGHGSGGVVGGGHGSGGVVGGGVVGSGHGSGGAVGGGHETGGVIGGGLGSGGVIGGGGYDGPIGGVSGPPYPSCAAGLLCVEENKCNLYTGFIGARIPLYEGQPFIEYAVSIHSSGLRKLANISQMHTCVNLTFHAR